MARGLLFAELRFGSPQARGVHKKTVYLSGFLMWKTNSNFWEMFGKIKKEKWKRKPYRVLVSKFIILLLFTCSTLNVEQGIYNEKSLINEKIFNTNNILGLNRSFSFHGRSIFHSASEGIIQGL